MIIKNQSELEFDNFCKRFDIDKVGGAGMPANLGRLQLFAVPTLFKNKPAFSLSKSIIKNLYGRFKYVGYRWDWSKIRSQKL